MKTNSLITVAAMVAVVTACASTHQMPAAVGPDPYVAELSGPDGYLQVFTAPAEPNARKEHTEYYLYDWNGKEMGHIHDVNTGSMETGARMVRLAPGTYRMKALASEREGGWITFPVVIDQGRTTDVHLNGKWQPPAEARVGDLVHSPSGYPLGFRAAMPPQG